MAATTTTSSRHARRWLGAVCLLPILALAQTPLDERIAAAREISRFVPETAYTQLQQVEAEARRAAPATRIEFLSQLSLATVRKGQHAAALQLAEELISYAASLHDDAALAKAWLTKGLVLYAMADRPTSQQYVFQADKLAASTGDKPLQVRARIAAGQAWGELGDYPAALARFQQAVELARQLDPPILLASALNSLATLYSKMKEFDKSFEVLAENVAVAEQLQSLGAIAVAKNTEYAIATDAGQLPRARRALLVALDAERKLGAMRLLARGLSNMSDSYLKAHDYPNALQFARQALPVAHAGSDAYAEAASWVNIGQAQLGMGQLAEGKKSVETGLVFFDKTNDKPALQDLMVDYGAALEKAGDLAGALAAYHRERTLSNELFEQQRQKAVYELAEKYETDKKKRQIELLSRENQVKGAEIENRRLQQRVWWLLAVVFALVAVMVGLLYRKVRQTNAQLEVKNLELEQQSAHDPLTGLYNRRHFHDLMRRQSQQQLPQRRASDAALAAAGGADDLVGALFLLDVDHFKHVNDRHGHAAGDAVLKMIAAKLPELLRDSDIIVRWGGEEFLAYLPAVPRRLIDDIARRILVGIAGQRVAHQEHAIGVTVSIGYAPFPLQAGALALPWERAVNLIDMALYLAKGHGRNRAYGVRAFARFDETSMEQIEQDLERAWRAGHVDMSVVLGAGAEQAAPAPAGQAGAPQPAG